MFLFDFTGGVFVGGRGWGGAGTKDGGGGELVQKTHAIVLGKRQEKMK